MTRLVEMEWPTLGKKIGVRLLEDKATELCQAVWESLPVESIQWHAVISGQGIGIPCRVVWTNMENPVGRQAGDVYFYGNGQLIIVTYGETTEPCKVNKFAEVLPQDRETSRQVGEAIWESLESNTLDVIPVKVVQCQEESVQ